MAGGIPGPRLDVLIGTDLKGLRKGTVQASAILDQWGRKIQRMGIGVTAVFGVIAAAAASALAQVEFSTAQIATLMDDVTKNTIPAMRDEIVELSVQFGQSFEEMAKARYDIVSAGFRSIAESVEVLAAANELALAGAAEVSVTARLIVQALRAYGLEAEHAATVSDLFFQTVKLGLTTVPELGTALGRIFSTARAAGVGLEQLQAAVSVITVITGNTAESVNALNRLLFAMSAPTGAAAEAMEDAGIKVTDFSGRVKSLTDIIQQFRRMNLGQIKELIGGRMNAAKAMAVMAQNTNLYEEALKAMAESAGSARKASAIMLDTSVIKWRQLKQSINELRVEIGKTIDEDMRAFLTGVFDTVRGLTKWISANKDLVSSFINIGIRMGIIITAFGTLMRVGSLLLKTVWMPLLTNPIGVVFTAAAIALTFLASKTKRATAELSTFLEAGRDLEVLELTTDVLIKEYDRLKDKTSLTIKEQEELREIIDELSRTFPEATLSVDNYGRTIDISAEKVQELIRQQMVLNRVTKRPLFEEAKTSIKETLAALGDLQTGFNNARRVEANAARAIHTQRQRTAELQGGMVLLIDGERISREALIQASIGATRRLMDQMQDATASIKTNREEYDELMKALKDSTEVAGIFFDLQELGLKGLAEKFDITEGQAQRLLDTIKELNREALRIPSLAPEIGEQPFGLQPTTLLFGLKELSTNLERLSTAFLLQSDAVLDPRTGAFGFEFPGQLAGKETFEETEELTLSLADAWTLVNDASVRAIASADDIVAAEIMIFDAGADMFRSLAVMANRANADILAAFFDLFANISKLLAALKTEAIEDIIPGLGGVLASVGILGSAFKRNTAGGLVMGSGVGHRLELVKPGEFIIPSETVKAIRSGNDGGGGSMINITISPQISMAGGAPGEASRVAALVAKESEDMLIRTIRDLKRRREI